MWRRTLLALRVPPLPPGQGTQQQQLLLGPQHLQPRLSLLLSTSPPIFCAAVIERLDPKPPFAFYEILHIPRHANQSQVGHNNPFNRMTTCDAGKGGLLPAVQEASPRCGRGEPRGQGQLCCPQLGLLCSSVNTGSCSGSI